MLKLTYEKFKEAAILCHRSYLCQTDGRIQNFNKKGQGRIEWQPFLFFPTLPESGISKYDNVLGLLMAVDASVNLI